MTEISKQQNDFLIKTATYASTFIALMIMIIKVIGWHFTNSIALFASLVDSLLDITASAINLVAVQYALRPPDDNHRFGHEKAQDLAVFGQSVFFGGSALFVIYNAFVRFNEPVPVEQAGIGIYVMIASTILTSVLVAYQYYVLRRTQSKVVAADKLHYLVDFLSNLGVLLSLYASQYHGYHSLDPVLAIAIAIYMLKGALELLIDAFKNLMDHEFSDREKQIIKDLINSHEEVKGFHDLKTRYASHKPFIQVHLEMDGEITLNQAHKIAIAVEEDIKSQFRGAEVIIHQDPEDVEEHVQYRA
jgi:cation diffusion facilitator family transporter